MKNCFSLLLLFLITLTGYAQEFEVREFKPQTNDLTARRYEKYTVNNEPAALIKVTTNIPGMKFDSNIGFVEIEHKQDGYWLWIAPQERRIRLMADGFLAKDVEMPEPAKSHVVYSMIVAADGGYQQSELVRLTFRLNQPNVYIRVGESAPVEALSRTSLYNLPRGRHTFRFMKDGFREKELTLDIDNERVVDVELEPGESSAKLPLSGWIIVDSDPRGAEVYLNEQRVGTTPYQQSHIAGSYTIRLDYPLYQSHTESFQLAEGANLSLSDVEMIPRFGYWQVTTRPAGAEVFLDGKYQGTSPLEKTPVESGMHELVLKYPMYHEHIASFLISNGAFENIEVDMRPAFGTLVIESEPTGATVFIDNKEAGTTPYTDEKLTSGLYTIRVQQDLFTTESEVAAVKDGETTEKFIALNPDFGTLQLSASQSDLYINEKFVGKGSSTEKLKPGSYKVRATREKHTSDEKEVYVTVGRTETVKLTPQPIQGALNISTTPFDARGAQIFIDGIRQSQTTPASIPMLIGEYEITVKKNGYLEATRTIEIREGQQHDVQIPLQTFAGSMQQKVARFKRSKILYGTGTLVALGAAGYLTWSSQRLVDDYSTATINATTIGNQAENHLLYSYVAYGVAVPLAVMWIVKGTQQRGTERRIDVTAAPVNQGAVVGVRIKIGP